MAHRGRICALTFLLSQICFGANPASSLAIVDAGIQQAEDAPFVNTDYQFLPGEFVYVEFHVAGYSFKVNPDTEVRSMSLTYSLVPEDAKDVPLTKPITGEIDEHLGTEDKNWLPVKRASFLLPSFVIGGTYYLHVTVQDVLGKTEVTKSLPFTIGGPHFEASDGLSIQHLRFLRREGDPQGMEVPAYSPGDTVYTDFDFVGFALKPGNEYHLSYGVTVLRPDGKTFLDQPNAAELRDHSFYPAQYLPATLEVLTKKDSPKGDYVVILTARDFISGKTAVTRRGFSIE